MVVHRGVVVPSNSELIGYNSDLAPKSDDYFPEIHLEGGTPRKPATPGHQGAVGPPNISIEEGGGKRHKISSYPLYIGVNQTKVNQPAVAFKDASDDGPGTADDFPALENLSNINKNGTANEMTWDAMVQEEVQDQLNYANKSDICAIDIILQY